MRTDSGGSRVSPRGVIGCLTAGFEMLGRNLLLVALPVVLDLVLWLGPRISVGPLVVQLAGLLEIQPSADVEVAGQIAQATRLLEQFAAEFNLLSVVGALPLLHVPSLLARRGSGASPLGEPRIFSVSSPLALLPWWGALVLAGLLLGFLYLNEIARQVEAGTVIPRSGTGEAAERRFLGEHGPDGAAASKFWRFLLFSIGVIVGGVSVVSLWLLVVALGTVVAQPLGILLWVAGVGFMSYAGLHLVFVVPGLLLGKRRVLQAVGESILLSHVNLPSVVGLLALVVVIYQGLAYAWSLPASNSWATLVGIAGNAFVGTGLTGACFLFYRDRLLIAGQPTEHGE